MDSIEAVPSPQDEDTMEEEFLSSDPLEEALFFPDQTEYYHDLDDSELDRSEWPETTDDTEEGPSKKQKRKSNNTSRKTDVMVTTEHDLFLCTLVVHKREFKGQTSGVHVAQWAVSANSSKEFLSKVWELASGFLCREIQFETSPEGNSTPQWSPKEKPSEDEFGKFALFQSARRYYKVEDIKNTLLQSWRGKEIVLYLHVYSLNVSSRTMWNSVKETLIEPAERDRAGAATTRANEELTLELREMHKEILTAQDMAWSFWANFILSSPAHTRSTLMKYPPQGLAGLFQAKEGPRIDAVRRELTTASSVNDSFHEDIVTLRKTFDAVRETVNQGFEEIHRQIERLELRDQTSRNLINAMKSSVTVEENEVGKSLRTKVTDCLDRDHS